MSDRIFHPIAGAAVGGALLLFFMLGLGGNSIFVGQLFLPQFFATAGSALHVHAFTTFATTLGGKTAYFIAAAVVVVACALGTRGAHVLARAMWWCFIAGVVGVVVLLFEAITHSNATFQAAYNAHTLPGAYDGVIAAARQRTSCRPADTFSGFLRLLAIRRSRLLGVYRE